MTTTDIVPVSENVEGQPVQVAVWTPRQTWLAERRRGVGASEVAAILGQDPRRGPHAVYLDKLNPHISEEESDWMAWGRDVEGAIAKAFARKTGRPIRDLGAMTILRHASAPLSATLDRETEGSESHPSPAPGPGPLECKAVSSLKKDEWVADPPLQFVIQLQAQMAVTGAAWGSLCALLGGLIPVWVDVPRNQRFIDMMLVEVEAFWRRVESQDPPPADGKPGTMAAIRAMYPKDSGREIVLPAECDEDFRKWKAAKEQLSKLKDIADNAEARLKAVMGDATYGQLPDGTFLKWRVEARKAYQVAASEPRVFRHTKSR